MGKQLNNISPLIRRVCFGGGKVRSCSNGGGGVKERKKKKADFFQKGSFLTILPSQIAFYEEKNPYTTNTFICRSAQEVKIF